MRSPLILVVFLLLSSCSSFNQGNFLSSEEKKFKLMDKSGEFLVKRKKGTNKKNLFFVKREVFSDTSSSAKLLEISKSFSKVGSLKKQKILRPHASVYKVWFDGKEYSNLIKINLEEKSLDVLMDSPEDQWKGKKSFRFPKDSHIFCFYSQIVECLGHTGFILQSIKSRNGNMKFHLIWEGYPYFQEQYLNVPNVLFEPAELVYDGTNKKGAFRFSLKTENHIQFIFVDAEGKLLKHYWVAQGLRMEEII